MKIIERILALMKEKNIKIKDIANLLSINTSVVSTWKKRKTDPPAEYLYRICDFLDVSLEYIYTGKDSHQNEVNLSEDEKCILTLYNQLNERNKIKLEGYIEGLLSLEEKALINKKSSFVKIGLNNFKENKKN